MSSIIVKDATENDAPIIAELIYVTEDYPEHIWGQGTKDEILNRLTYLIKNDQSRYSYRYTKVAVIDDRICGAIVLLHGGDIMKFDLLTSFKLLFLIRGVARKIKFLFDTIKGFGLNEAEEKELYVANIAALPEYRGRGIGKLLMEKAENEAKKNGYNLCSLLAKDCNVKSFYEKLNYVIKNEEVYYSHVLYRMVKSV